MFVNSKYSQISPFFSNLEQYLVNHGEADNLKTKEVKITKLFFLLNTYSKVYCITTLVQLSISDKDGEHKLK